MGRFVQAADRDQASFLPACLEDYVDADNPVRVIDAVIDELDLAGLGFARVQPAATGRPGYALAMMLKVYVCQIACNCDPLFASNSDPSWGEGLNLSIGI